MIRIDALVSIVISPAIGKCSPKWLVAHPHHAWRLIPFFLERVTVISVINDQYEFGILCNSWEIHLKDHPTREI
jgi:hypothetical protein